MQVCTQTQWGVPCSLQELHLSQNRICGPLEAMRLERMGSSLELLDLSSNAMLGSFAVALYGLPNLRWVSIARNRLNGTLPEIERQRKAALAIEHLDLSENRLLGTLPASTSCLLRMTFLSLRDNALSGTLDSLASLVALRHLDLGGNNFSGALAFIQSLRMLTHLSLDSSLLNQTAPQSFLKLGLLAMLEIVVYDTSPSLLMLCQLQTSPSTQLRIRFSDAKSVEVVDKRALCRTATLDPTRDQKVFVFMASAAAPLQRCCSIVGLWALMAVRLW